MTKLPRSASERYLSHQLLNALACIQQFGSILSDGLAGELSGEQREYLGIMLENASQIRQLLDSVLDGTDGSFEERGLEV
jgi:two-component system sensor histidine kinase GlrK